MEIGRINFHYDGCCHTECPHMIKDECPPDPPVYECKYNQDEAALDFTIDGENVICDGPKSKKARAELAELCETLELKIAALDDAWRQIEDDKKHLNLHECLVKALDDVINRVELTFKQARDLNISVPAEEINWVNDLRQLLSEARGES